MKCEYCGSYLSVFPDNGCCPNCGAVLPEPEAVKPKLPEPPLGIYSGDNCWLEIGKDSVRIRKRVVFDKITDYEIAYHELTNVIYQPGLGEKRGYLCLRCTLNQYTPFPNDEPIAIADPTTVVFKENANGAFFTANTFLQCCLNADLQKPKTPQVYFPNPPVGTYRGRNGTLEITQDAVCFATKNPLVPQRVYWIPFEDLCAATMDPPTWSRYSILRVRCWQNRWMGFGDGFYDFQTSLILNSGSERYFYGVYRFLQDCARIANEARKKSEY